MKSIKITIDEDASIEVEAVGFKGKACEQATAALIKALGTTVSSKKKPEYRQEERRTIHN
jgi:hypothetical protein